MQTTHVYGLKDEAIKFLEDNVETIPDIICQHCGEIVTRKKNSRIYENAKSAGMCKDGPLLYEYILKDGRIVREVINKHRPWSSGLCLFLDLVDKNKNVLYGWTDEEITSKVI